MFDQLWTDHTQLNEQLKLINWTKYKRSNYASFIVIKPNQNKQTWLHNPALTQFDIILTGFASAWK